MAEGAAIAKASAASNALAGAVIALAAVAVYANSFSGPFVLDDAGSILDNPTIRHLWPIGKALQPPGGGLTVTGRPILNLSLAINYAISGTNVWSYHAVNLLIHVLAGLTLFGILRRTLQTVWAVSPERELSSRSWPRPHPAAEPAVRGSRGPEAADEASNSPQAPSQAKQPKRSGNATGLAFVIALLWTVHPLQTEAVTYVIQRAESLMGLFYLLTLYCFIRGTELEETRFAGPEGDRSKKPAPGGSLLASLPASGPRDPRAAGSAGSLGIGQLRPSGSRLFRTITLRPRGYWYVLSFLACLFGMGTKEVMVSAPLIVFLYDRTFVSGSFREAWRRRRPLYLGLAATWILLAGLVAGTGGDRGGTSGWGSGVGAPAYWATQFSAIVRYLGLAVWPRPLVFDYGVDWVRHPGEVIPCAVLVIGLIAATAYALFRGGFRFRQGFGGQALGFAGAWFFLILAPTSLVPGNRQTMAEQRMYLPLAAVIVVLVLVLGAFAAKVVRLWRMGGNASVLTPGVVPVLLAAAVGLGWATARRNEDYRSDLALYADNVAKRPGNAFAQANLGMALFSLGRVPAAVDRYEEALRLRPDYPVAEDNLGNALLRLDRVPEAVGHYERALRLDPGFADAHSNLASALVRLGRIDEAAGHCREALRLRPDDTEAWNNLGNLLAMEGKTAEAVAQYAQALRLDPDYAAAHYNLANALARLGRVPEALTHYQAALRLQPDFPEAAERLGRLEAQTPAP